jgi:hypothetical protein
MVFLRIVKGKSEWNKNIQRYSSFELILYESIPKNNNRVYQCRHTLYSKCLDLLPLMLTLEERVSIVKHHYRYFFFSHSVKGVSCRKGFQWENFYSFMSFSHVLRKTSDLLMCFCQNTRESSDLFLVGHDAPFPGSRIFCTLIRKSNH